MPERSRPAGRISTGTSNRPTFLNRRVRSSGCRLVCLPICTTVSQFAYRVELACAWGSGSGRLPTADPCVPQPPCIMGAVLHASRRTDSLLVLLFLCALMCAQSASFASEHSHRHASQHCCLLCHSGPLPLLQPVISTAISPMLAVAWLSLSSDFATPHEGPHTPGSSRAPPLQLPI